jgi:acyl-[acyl-carrier-protein]-phospholipid O-acyltransferase/long-chain-fatty-acid--[acyl-carrier-protein] ligase
VGRLVPGVAAKILDLDSGEELTAGESGMLYIKGTNVMHGGYLDEPDLTAKVVSDGWYQTGDVALIDDEGFVQITGRQSRFSKIGGEMVPHIKIEELLADLIGGDEEDGLKAAVTAVPDERKGERLIVLHTKIDKSPDALREGLSGAGLPNIYIPSADSFREIAEMPVLGTGKLDLKGLKQMAMDLYAS